MQWTSTSEVSFHESNREENMLDYSKYLFGGLVLGFSFGSQKFLLKVGSLVSI